MQESMLILMMLITLGTLAGLMLLCGGLLFAEGQRNKATEDWIDDDPEKPNPKTMIWQGAVLVAVGFAGIDAVICAAYTASL